jgi:hypothetical protein
VDELKAYRMQCYVMPLANAASINQAILAEYARLRDDPALNRSHFFAGRYENVYVPEPRMPALRPVLVAARRGAAEYLRQPGLDLSVGFWLNEMAPGHVTLPHRHDEDDELVSAVYYVNVPEASGELVMTRGMISIRVTPLAGQFVFFPPDVLHEVTANCSRQTRLSIGMNFGIRG